MLTAIKGMSRGVAALALTVAVFGGVILVGWRVGWWFTTENVRRQDQVYDQSYGRQTALKDQVTKNIALTFTITTQIAQAGGDPDVTAPLTAQRAQVVGMVCSDASKINDSNPLRGDQAALVAENCLAGAVNPKSTYAK